MAGFGGLLYHQVGEEIGTSAQLAQWLRRPGDGLGYLYDFGDQWVHRIEAVKVISRPRAPVPRLVARGEPARRRTAAGRGDMRPP